MGALTETLKIVLRDADNKRYEGVLSDRRRYDELMTMDEKSEIVVDELIFSNRNIGRGKTDESR